ncbi:MAG: recombinase family protein [Anaerotignum sp.]|nr:recombinase family protein [Anaerotignum sp.]
MEQYCIYLRKSRADDEAEQRGEGETLARHEKALLSLANSQHLTIGQIYREIVSGETLAARPVMQQLLADVEKGLWQGVIVMEVERLARGNTLDQGIVANAFKYSSTLIVTPTKTYDPNNEFDEEYFEFGLFMSRREYKTINRRMQQGRQASVSEGKYCGSIPPFGYTRKKIQGEKGYTLAIVPEEAEIVKMMYELYAYGDRAEDGTYKAVGRNTIARHLNKIGIKNRKGGAWATSSVTRMLQNPVYMGKLTWDYRKTIKRTENGKVIPYRPINKNPLIYDGLHEAIVSEELWHLVADKIKNNRPSVIPDFGTMKNPLASIVRCALCQNAMQRRPYEKTGQPASMICNTHGCPNISAPLYAVEARLMEALEHWVEEYKVSLKNPKSNTQSQKQVIATTVEALQKEISNLHTQLDNTFDLLEQGIYTTEIFTKRNQTLTQKISEKKEKLHDLIDKSELIKKQEHQNITLIPKIEYLLDVYYKLSPAEQNKLLREVVDHADYKKTINGRWHSSPDSFELLVYPKITKDF